MLSFTLETQRQRSHEDILRSRPGLEPGSGLDVPEAAVLSGCSSRNDLGDEDGRVVSNVRIIGPSCDAEAQT